MNGEAEKIITQLSGFSYLGVFGISLIANVLFIVPEEVVLLSLGYISRAGNVDIFVVIPIVIMGLLTSDILLYSLSRQGSRIIDNLYDKFFSKRLAFFSKRLTGKQEWMRIHIEKVIFYSRFLMQLRFLGPFMAGKLKVSRRKFLVYELAALVVYVPLLLWLGWYFRSRVESVIGNISQIHKLILLMVLLMIFLPIIQSLGNRFFRKGAAHEI